MVSVDQNTAQFMSLPQAPKIFRSPQAAHHGPVVGSGSSQAAVLCLSACVRAKPVQGSQKHKHHSAYLTQVCKDPARGRAALADAKHTFLSASNTEMRRAKGGACITIRWKNNKCPPYIILILFSKFYITQFSQKFQEATGILTFLDRATFLIKVRALTGNYSHSYE